jgi:Bacterial Ig-like domain (group 2)
VSKRCLNAFGCCGLALLSLGLSSCGGDGSTTKPAPPPLPTVSLSATSAVVALAGPDTLVWSTTGADSCTASGGWSGAQAVSGRFTTGPLTTQTSYTLTCSGAGGTALSSVTVSISSTLPPAGPVAVLSPSVRSSAVASVFQQSPGLLIIGPDPSIHAGQILVLGGIAYKVVGYNLTTGDPAWFPPDYIPESVEEVYTVAPALDEIFDQIDISGTYTLDASQMSAQSSASALGLSDRQKLTLSARPAAAASVPISLDFNQSDLQIQGNANVAVQVTPSIHYSKGTGFTGSSVGFSLAANATASVSATTALIPVTTVFISSFSIPIPLTVIDAQSNLVAVSAASVTVPVSLLVQPSIAYGLSYESTWTAASSSTISIAADGSLSTNVTAGSGSPNSLSISSSSVSPPASSPASTSIGNSLFAGLDLSASLQALGTVNLLTADSRIGSRYQGDLTILTAGGSPTYCGAFAADSEVQLMATLQLSTNSAPFIAASPIGFLNSTATQPIGAYCTTTPAVIAALEPAVIFSPSAISIAVISAAGAGAPAPVPTGSVQASVDGASCTAALDSTGKGSCDLTPSIAGARALSFQYLGDGIYPASSVVTQPLAVDLAQTVLTMTYAPNPVSTASEINFNFSVRPNPDNGTQPRPTGSVLVNGFVGGSCTATLDSAGNGACTGQIPPGVSAVVDYPAAILVAQYSGDGNYAVQTLANVNLPVIVLTVSGPQQLMVGDTGQFVAAAADGFSSAALATPPNLQWTSSNPAVATVNAGTVTAIAVGTATITATDPASLASASVNVTVAQ